LDFRAASGPRIEYNPNSEPARSRENTYSPCRRGDQVRSKISCCQLSTMKIVALRQVKTLRGSVKGGHRPQHSHFDCRLLKSFSVPIEGPDERNIQCICSSDRSIRQQRLNRTSSANGTLSVEDQQAILVSILGTDALRLVKTRPCSVKGDHRPRGFLSIEGQEIEHMQNGMNTALALFWTGAMCYQCNTLYKGIQSLDDYGRHISTRSYTHQS